MAESAHVTSLRELGAFAFAASRGFLGSCTQIAILWPQSTYIGISLRPKYSLLGYMDPQGFLMSECAWQGEAADVADAGEGPIKALSEFTLNPKP